MPHSASIVLPSLLRIEALAKSVLSFGGDSVLVLEDDDVTVDTMRCGLL